MFHPLVDHGYGKSGVRLMRVTRRGDRHDVQDLSVAVRLEGAYEPSYVVGDNSMVLPTDTMKNTVYAFAREHAGGDIESFGLALTDRFLHSHEAVVRARVDLEERPWRRISVGAKPHGQAFLQPGGERRTAVVSRTRQDVEVKAGIAGLTLLKTGGSGFTGFLREEYTTLAETSDRLLATVVTASWQYGRTGLPYGSIWHGVRQQLLEAFARHDSRSVQHTLYAMAEAVLETQEEVIEIRMSLPNRHHWLVDLTPFGQTNRNEVFAPSDEPHGAIDATVRRRSPVT